MVENVTGVVAPVLTPFDEEGNLVPGVIADSVDYTLSCGCHGVVASGTGVQETAMLAPDERKTLISETVAAVDGEVPVLAGVSYPAQPIVTDLVEHAESVGVDGVLAMPPWGIDPGSEGTVEYFKGIAAATDLPILVYNNPSVTVDMDRETMARVAEIDGVEYVKESSRDWQKIGWLLERIHHEGLAEVLTTMDVLLATLQAGGSGAIVPAPASTPAMRIYDAVQAGDLDEAIDVQRTFGTFPPDEAETGLLAVCKAATELAGVDVGPPRPPYRPVSPRGREAIAEWMEVVDIPRFDG